MKTITAVFILALILAPVANFNPVTWGGQYAHWQLPDNRVEASLLALNDDPPKPKPDDTTFCQWNPFLCGRGPYPTVRGN